MIYSCLFPVRQFDIAVHNIFDILTCFDQKTRIKRGVFRNLKRISVTKVFNGMVEFSFILSCFLCFSTLGPLDTRDWRDNSDYETLFLMQPIFTHMRAHATCTLI